MDRVGVRGRVDGVKIIAGRSVARLSGCLFVGCVQRGHVGCAVPYLTLVSLVGPRHMSAGLKYSPQLLVNLLLHRYRVHGWLLGGAVRLAHI